MSDTSMGPGWWQASDGKWYAPSETDTPPEPGWWLAADGKWYPPRESDTPPEPGWWLAADGKWYAPTNPDPDPVPEAPVAAAPVPSPEPAPRAATTEAAPRTHAPATNAANGATGSNGGTGSPEAQGSNGSAPAAARSTALGTPTDASEQIRRRNQASRDDAVTQFPARFLAAARAVQVLESELGRTEPGLEPTAKKHERKGRARAEAMAAEAKAKAKAAKAPEAAPSAWVESAADHPASANGAPLGDPMAAPVAPAAIEPPAPEPEPDPSPTVPVGRPTSRPGDQQGWPAPPAVQPTQAARAPAVGQPGGPLMELRPSPLGADLDHLGDRLLVFEDRVELRDRSDHVRQYIAGPDLTDVGVQRKFTGAVLTIAGSEGEPIVVKGLKPEQADEVQRLIQTRLRHPHPAGEAPDDTAAPVEGQPEAPPEESALAAPSPDAVANAADRLAILNRSRLNEADLLRKLADLHRAGVLSDNEFSEKISLVGRLVSGETIVVV